LECTATAEDLNGDGKLDLAVRNAELNGATGNVLVLLGNGDGTFQSALAFETGLKPEQVVAGDFNGDGRLDLAVPNFSDNTVSVLLQGTTVALSDISLRFGLQFVNTVSTAEVVTLTNTGPTTLNISSIISSGDFLQENNCGPALPAGASCTIRVAFRPSMKGARTGAVTITDDAPDSPQTVALMGTGTVVQLTSMNVNFGNQRVGTTSSPRTVTLTNTGSTPLSIYGIALTGANFGDFAETTTCGSSLPAHTSCAIEVRFRPAATSAREASLRVRDDGGGGTQDVKLGGPGFSN
jgi:archaellum component FlaF (FlaF/FlaG flagellin family)